MRAAKYGSLDKNQYFNTANIDTLMIIQIEGMEDIENISEIIEIEGMGIIFIGSYDLAQSIGILGDINNIIVQEMMKEVVNKTSKKEKIIGTFVDGVDMIKKWNNH